MNGIVTESETISIFFDIEIKWGINCFEVGADEIFGNLLKEDFNRPFCVEWK